MKRLKNLKRAVALLEFQYGTSTKATGENESEWNEYKGRLKQVLFEAESPSSKKMEAPIAVADYTLRQTGAAARGVEPTAGTSPEDDLRL